MLALNLTIWIALALFVAGELGRSERPTPRWAWWTFALGLLLALVHTAIAFHVVHGWRHQDAVSNTARQTEAIFGTAFGWGVYVNYVFFAVWLADAWWWRAGRAPQDRPAALTWTLRIFYLTILVNAAVIFAVPSRRLLGALVIALLGWAWRPRLAHGIPR